MTEETKQPEALRLAMYLEGVHAPYHPETTGFQAAAEELRRQRAEIDRPTKHLHGANSQAEKFERKWYLRGDEVEAKDARIAELESENRILTADLKAAQAEIEITQGLHDREKASRQAAQKQLEALQEQSKKIGLDVETALVHGRVNEHSPIAPRLQQIVSTLEAIGAGGVQPLRAEPVGGSDERALVALAVQHHIRFPRNKDLIAFVNEARAARACPSGAAIAQEGGK